MIEVRFITEGDILWRPALACLGDGSPEDRDRHARIVARRIAHHRRFVRDADCLVAAVRGGSVIDAALCLEYPGRSATCLLPAEAEVAGVAPSVTAQLLATLIQRCRDRGVLLVEGTDRIDARHRGRSWADAGFRFVTRLLYLDKELDAHTARTASSPKREHVRTDAASAIELAQPGEVLSRSAPSLRWVPYSECDPDEVAALYAATCRESQDFPELTGLRGARDAIASHRVAGDSDTKMWWVAADGHQPVAMALLTLHEAMNAVEVVYLGVIPDVRGRGVGHALLARAEREASATSAKRLTLAVDRRNGAGTRLYDRWGFHVLAERDAWLMVLS